MGGLVAAVFLLLGSAGAHASVLPTGFGETTITSGADAPTAVAWAPDGRLFITQKGGRVLVRDPDGTVKTLLDISAEVNDLVDRGLIGIAVDKDFASNGYLYLLYSHELEPQNPDSPDPMASRLTRVTVKADDTLQSPGNPETVILGTESNANCPQPDNTLDCIPGDFYFHSVGTVRSDPVDGTLWIGSGESHPHAVDSLSYRPYDPESFAGKLIHIDRNGHGLPGHPFCPGDNDLTHVCTKIYALGFRNPFRFTLRPGAGPAVADVGQAAREELDLVQPGKNYGWPCYEGPIHTPLYESETRCQQEYAKEGTAAALTPPSWSYENPTNPDDGASIVAGPVYAGPNYPASYNGKLFVADYAAGWIKLLTIDANDQVTGVTPFATGVGSPVDLETMPNGDLAYVDIGFDPTGAGGPGSVHRITYANGNLQPTPVADATPLTGAPPLTVQFTGSDSTDPEGDALSYEWDFGDGSAHSTQADPSHTYAAAGSYTARLTVDDGTDRFPSASVQIEVGEPPSAEITAPADGASYRDGVPVRLSGTGTDPEDGALAGSSLTWHIVLHHDDHVHDFATQTGATAQFTPVQDHDADSHYQVTLTARDSSGQTAQDSLELFPQTSHLTLNSSPPGALLGYADAGLTAAPVERTAAVGFKATIEAPVSYVYQGRTYTFSAWSDGGAAKHVITVPATDTTLTALYSRTVPPDTAITAGTSGLTSSRSASFTFASDDPGSNYQCSFDGSVFQPCSSPWVTGGLSDGDHGFSVRATDPYAGTPDPTPASRTFDVDATPPGTVHLRRTQPASPSPRNRFTVVGAAEAGSWVRLYETADCTGPEVSGGSAADLGGAGLPVRVADNHTIALRAVAVDVAGNRSACPVAPLRYVEDSRAPGTELIRGPSGPTTDRTPTFRFRSDEAGSSFQCRRDEGEWRACGPPVVLRRLALGRHVFAARAIDAAGNLGPPERQAFTVVAQAARRYRGRGGIAGAASTAQQGRPKLPS